MYQNSFYQKPANTFSFWAGKSREHFNGRNENFVTFLSLNIKLKKKKKKANPNKKDHINTKRKT